jgi:hypothetical protein
LRKNVPTGKCFAVCSWLNMNMLLFHNK